MASPITSGAFPDALNPVFRKQSREDFAGTPDLVGQLFGSGSSDRNQERITSISGLPDFVAFTGSVSYAGPDEGYDVTVTHKQFARGVQIQRTLWDDDQHGQIRQIFTGLGRAAHNTRQKDAAQPFNTAFTTDSEFYTHTEGVSLCSNSHTTTVEGVDASSGFDNLITNEMSGTAFTVARYTMRLFNDFQGEPIDEVFDEVLVPAELEDEALVILRTRTGLDTASGDANVHQMRNIKLMSSARLTDSNNWFVMNSRLRNDNLVWIDRTPFETARMEAFDQMNFKGRGYMRYSYYWLFWQFILGAQVS